MNTPPKKTKLQVLRDYAALAFLEVTALLLAVGLLVGWAGPILIDLHNDTANVLAILCFIGGPLFLIYGASALYRGYRHFCATYDAATDKQDIT